MRILFFTQLLPYPPHTGGIYKTFAILKLLAKKHDVQVVTFHDQKMGIKNARKLEKICRIKVKSFYRPVVTAPSKEIKHIALQSLLSTKPFRVHKYYDTRVVKYIQSITKSEIFNIVYIDHNTSFQYLKYIRPSPKTNIIFDEHNINSLAMLRNAKERRRRLHVRLFSLIDVIKNYFYEKRIVKSVDVFFCISPKDREYFLKIGANPKTTKLLPVPFETQNLFNPNRKPPTILFAGLMSWAPNKFGVLWFYNKVYPIIKKKIPKVRLFLVGPKPEEEILKIADIDKSVNVTGEVASLAPYYKKASVFVAPTFSGSGLRIKIPHALSSGIPVVSTKFGVEGILNKEKSGVLVANTEDSFANAIIKLILMKKRSKKLGEQGLVYIKNHYSEKKALRVLNSTL